MSTNGTITGQKFQSAEQYKINNEKVKHFMCFAEQYKADNYMVKLIVCSIVEFYELDIYIAKL